MTDPCDPRTTTGHSWAALGTLTLAVMLLAIDGTVLTLTILALIVDLASSVSQILWIGDIYLLTLSGLPVVTGNLADRIGRKRLLTIGSVRSGLPSLLAAFITSPELLIAAWVLLGINGATIIPSMLALVRSVLSDQQQRTRVITTWSVGAMAGAAIEPIVGRVLLKRFPWGSVFPINVPAMVAVVAGGLRLLPESRNPGKGRVDLLSAVLSMAAIISPVQAVKEIFSAGFTITVAVALALGMAMGWWFLRRQRTLTTPLIDISLFHNRSFTAVVTTDTMTIFAFVGLLFFLSQYLQFVRGPSLFQTGLLGLSGTAAAIVVVAFTGIVVREPGTGSAISAGLGLDSVSLVILVFAGSMTGLAGIVVAFALVGSGIGLSTTLNTDAIVGAVPTERAGAVSSMAETAYELGTVLGIALLGSVHIALYRAALPSGTDPAIRELLVSAVSLLDPTDAALPEAWHVFTMTMQWTSVVAAVLLAVTAVLAWFIIPCTTSLGEEAILEGTPWTNMERSARQSTPPGQGQQRLPALGQTGLRFLAVADSHRRPPGGVAYHQDLLWGQTVGRQALGPPRGIPFRDPDGLREIEDPRPHWGRGRAPQHILRSRTERPDVGAYQPPRALARGVEVLHHGLTGDGHHVFKEGDDELLPVREAVQQAAPGHPRHLDDSGQRSVRSSPSQHLGCSPEHRHTSTFDVAGATAVPNHGITLLEAPEGVGRSGRIPFRSTGKSFRRGGHHPM